MTFLQCLKTWQLFLPSPSPLSCVYTGKKCENESGYEIEISCIPNHHQVSVEVPLNSHFFTWSLSLSGIYWSPLVLTKFGHFYNFKTWTYGVQDYRVMVLGAGSLKTLAAFREIPDMPLFVFLIGPKQNAGSLLTCVWFCDRKNTLRWLVRYSCTIWARKVWRCDMAVLKIVTPIYNYSRDGCNKRAPNIQIPIPYHRNIIDNDPIKFSSLRYASSPTPHFFQPTKTSLPSFPISNFLVFSFYEQTEVGNSIETKAWL